MLDRTFPLPGDELCGIWSRWQLEQMDERFVAAVTAAFAAKLESPEAARATYVKPPRVSREEALRAALESAWQFCCDRNFDLPFAEVVGRVRACCPGIDPAVVQAEFKRRFKNGGGPAYVGTQ